MKKSGSNQLPLATAPILGQPPSKQKKGEYLVLYLSMKGAGITKVELARQIGTNEKEVRRILDPHYETKLPTIERALSVLGKHAELVIS